ncbi:MAG: putative RND superfamily exporter protein [Sphingobacteriales bacterium]|jgi:predicted RND superfamily exporter protein
MAFINRWKFAVLFILLAIVAGISYQAKDLKLSYDFESFFPENSEELDNYNAYKDKFGGDADFLLLGIPLPAGFNTAVLQKLISLKKNLKNLRHVRELNSPLDLKIPIQSPMGLIPVPLFQESDQESWTNKLIQFQPLILPFLDSSQTRMALRVELENNLSKVKSDLVLAQIQGIMDGTFPNGYCLAGRIHGQKVILDKMGDNLKIFSILGALLVAFFLGLFFRFPWGIWAPILLLLLVSGTTAGVLGLCGIPLNILGTIIPTILFVVTCSDAIHLMERYIHELKNGENKLEALKTSFKEIGVATFLTSLTTCIGFAALLAIPIIPIQQFGIQVSIGVAIAYLLTFSFFITLILILPLPKIASKPHANWRRILGKTFYWITRKPKQLWMISTILIVLCILGCLRLSVNNQLLEDWDKSSDAYQGYVFFEDHFGGIRPIEFELTLGTKEIIDSDNFWLEIEELSSYLVAHYGITQLASPSTILHQLNVVDNLGGSELSMKTKRGFVKKVLKKQRLFHSPSNTLRLFGRGKDYGGIYYTAKTKALITFLEERKFQSFRVSPTGLAHLVDSNNIRLSYGLVQGIGLAVMAVFLLLLLIFRNWRPAVAAVLPNLFPLLGVLAAMGFAGIEMKVSTAIVLTIVFGLAVDDTIHYMNGYLLWKKKLVSPVAALKATQFSTGKAIIITSIVLVGGFGLLLFSGFTSTYHLGLLVSLGLLLAVPADLILLPLCLFSFMPKTKNDVA